MKNLFIKLIACLMIAFCTMGMYGCSVGSVDIADVRSKLLAKGYEVETGSGTDIFQELLGPGDDFGAKEMLLAYSENEEEYLLIIHFDSLKFAKLAYEMGTLEYSQEIESAKKRIEFCKFILDKYSDDEMTSEEIDQYQDEIKEAKKNIEENEELLKCVKRKGKFYIIGTKYALEDMK